MDYPFLRLPLTIENFNTNLLFKILNSFTKTHHKADWLGISFEVYTNFKKCKNVEKLKKKISVKEIITKNELLIVVQITTHSTFLKLRLILLTETDLTRRPHSFSGNFFYRNPLYMSFLLFSKCLRYFRYYAFNIIIRFS